MRLCKIGLFIEIIKISVNICVHNIHLNRHLTNNYVRMWMGMHYIQDYEAHSIVSVIFSRIKIAAIRSSIPANTYPITKKAVCVAYRPHWTEKRSRVALCTFLKAIVRFRLNKASLLGYWISRTHLRLLRKNILFDFIS